MFLLGLGWHLLVPCLLVLSTLPRALGFHLVELLLVTFQGVPSLPASVVDLFLPRYLFSRVLFPNLLIWSSLYFPAKLTLL